MAGYAELCTSQKVSEALADYHFIGSSVEEAIAIIVLVGQ
jgi:hypothetical protein